MFSWNEFSKNALADSVLLCNTDKNLRRILLLDEIPPAKTGKYGDPLPGCVLVNQHPNPVELIRTIKIRKGLSEDVGNHPYSEYADRFLLFLETLPVGASLFLINIVTQHASYEFAYSPRLKNVFSARVPE